MFPGYHTKAVNMFRREVNATNGEMVKDLAEIEKWRYNAEDRLAMEKEIGNWKPNGNEWWKYE